VRSALACSRRRWSNLGAVWAQTAVVVLVSASISAAEGSGRSGAWSERGRSAGRSSLESCDGRAAGRVWNRLSSVEHSDGLSSSP
jgi:hypothetical protein